MKKLVVTVALLFVALSTVHNASAQGSAGPNHFQYRGKYSEAYYERNPTPCITETASVYVGESVFHSTGKRVASGPAVVVYVSKYDHCTGFFLFSGSNYDPNTGNYNATIDSLSFNNDGAAKVSATATLNDVSNGSTLTVRIQDLKWLPATVCETSDVHSLNLLDRTRTHRMENWCTASTVGSVTDGVSVYTYKPSFMFAVFGEVKELGQK